MEYMAISKGVRISSRKVSLVADSIRGSVLPEVAIEKLALIKKRGAYPLIKTLKSAIANAQNKGAKKESLFIKTIEVTQGPALKRFHPGARGRIKPYKKRSSNIRIVLMDDKSQISLPADATHQALQAGKLKSQNSKMRQRR